jgi:hypothetical protein
MKPPGITAVITVLSFLFLQWGCTTPPPEQGTYLYTSKTFIKEYDEVWDTLVEVLNKDLMYPIRHKDKNKGILETDWTSVIRIRGTLRWNVRVLLERAGNTTVVKVYDRIEEPAPVRDKLKNKRGEMKTGWIPSEEKIAEVDNILKTLSARLDE